MRAKTRAPQETAPAWTEEEEAHRERVRAWVRLRLERTSFRQLGKEIGISGPAVYAFARRGAPLTRSWSRLWAWFERDRRRPGPLGTLDDSPEETAALFLLLVRSIPRERRHGALRRLARKFKREHRRSGVPAPAWLLRLDEVARAGGG